MVKADPYQFRQATGERITKRVIPDLDGRLGAGGLPALALFLVWIALPLYAALRPGAQDPRAASMLACVTLAFAAGSLFNSSLLDFTEGHIYAALAAWLLAWRRPA